MVKIDKEKPSYIPFYKVMLILSTIGTSIGTIGVLGLSDTLSRYSIAPLFIACAVLLNVVTIVSIYALVLLWQKNPLGISLKISTYIVSIIATIGALIGAKPYAEHIITLTKEQVQTQPSQFTQQIIDMVPSIVNFIIYGGLVTSIIVAITFSLLWLRAWKKQKEADEPPAPSSKKKP